LTRVRSSSRRKETASGGEREKTGGEEKRERTTLTLVPLDGSGNRQRTADGKEGKRRSRETDNSNPFVPSREERAAYSSNQRTGTKAVLAGRPLPGLNRKKGDRLDNASTVGLTVLR